jgi:signal transduction histidine kinase
MDSVWWSGAVGVSGIVVSVTCLALVVAVCLATSRPAGPRRRWLATTAVVLMLVGFAVPAWQQLWFIAFPLLVATFPDGRFVPRWMTIPVAASVVITAGDLITGGQWSEQPWWGAAAAVQLVLLAAQVYRYRRRATTEERQAVRWLILGTLLTVACYASIQLAFGVIGEGSVGSQVTARLAVLPLCLGAAAGVIRPGAVDVDRLLHATIGVLVAATPLVVLYQLVSRWSGDWQAAVVVAIATWPLAAVARRAADWAVFRGRLDADHAVSALLTRLGESSPSDTVPGVVLDEAVHALHLDGGRIEGSWFTTIVRATPEPTADAIEVTYRGDRLATLWLTPRRGESAFTPRDRQVLNQLAAHSAPALHGARTLVELQESRARVVATREEERRQLRRDLHDDLGPTLTGVALSAAALARRTGLPEAVELHTDIQTAVQQSRAIAYGLRPAVLDDHGLVAAIRDRTNGPEEPPVRVRAPELPDLPAAVDLAALRIITEAVTNARKHAAASTIEVGLELTHGRLAVVVSDDGVGLPADVRPGIGMRSMVERAAELGGTARYDRSAPGTRLMVTLPLETG